MDEALQHDCTDCPSPFVSWAYMSTWLCFAMYVFMNVIIAIVEDTWISLADDVPAENVQLEDWEMMAKAEDEGTVCCGSDGDFERTEMLFAKVVAEMAQEMGI